MIVEETLVSMLKNGNSSAFEYLVELYSQKIFRTAMFMLGNYDDANDAVQEVFFAVHKNIKKFNSKSSLSTWIYRITVNVCNSILRKRKNSPIILPDNLNIYSSDLVENILIRDAVFKLKNKYRTLIVLRDINGFSYDEISIILDIPHGTVKSRISRARAELRNILSDTVMKGGDDNELQKI